MTDLFIKEYENVLESDLCRQLINLFSDSETKHKGVTQGGLIENVKKTFDMHITNTISDVRISDEQRKQWKTCHDKLHQSLTTYLHKYYYDVGLTDLLKDKSIISNIHDTGFQIQHYIKNDGFYTFHHDFSTVKKNVCRIVTFLFYLNDVDEGGETNFFNQIYVKPKQGKLVFFPATWNYIHKGEMPKSNDKYIVTGWIYANI